MYEVGGLSERERDRIFERENAFMDTRVWQISKVGESIAYSVYAPLYVM